MTIQSGERSILPFGVAEIDCAGFCRDRLKKDIFVKSKTHVIGRKRLSAVRNGGWVLLLVDRGFICGHVSGKKSNSMRWQFSPLPGVRNSELAYLAWDQGIEASPRDYYCGESSYGFFWQRVDAKIFIVVVGSRRERHSPFACSGNFWIEARVTRGGRTHQRDAPFVSGPTTHE